MQFTIKGLVYKSSFLLLFGGIACTHITVREESTLECRTTIPIDQALSKMEELIDSQMAYSRACDNSQYEIMVLGGKDFEAETRAIGNMNIPDTLLYIINFGDEEGFSILSGDSRIKTSVFCLTEKGSVSKEDFIDAFCFLNNSNQEMEYDFESVLVPSLILASALPQCRGGGGEGGDDDEDHDDWLDWLASMMEDIGGGNGGYVNRGPFVRTKWAQEVSPLDSLVTGLSGCATIAVGQIIVANRYPNNMQFNNVMFNLDTLETVRHYSKPGSRSNPSSIIACSQAANFIVYLRSPDLLNMTGNGASADDVINALQHIGYSDVEKTHSLGSFSSDMSVRVMNMLNNNYPVFVGGGRWGGAHAWVIDGYLYSQSVLLFHINWGWNGYRDGYYDYGVFDSGATHIPDPIIDNGNSYSGPEYNYFFSFTIIEYSF